MAEEVQRKTLGMAVASLVLGCFFIIPLIGWLSSVAAIILGIVALVKINASKQALKGSGMAIAGIVLGAVGMFVGTIIMLAAIAIPNLLRARLMANESAAIAGLKTIASAAYTYRSANPGFPSELSRLYAGQTPPYIDPDLAGGTKLGYCFRLEGTDMDSSGNFQGFKANAWPVSAGQTGIRRFYVDTSGILRWNAMDNATATDTPYE
ncbi:MAG: DUF4190 domain-containing protein [Candidatus Omnitrophica bacterium]|nr:DUF4190 domain-containing protein [Candidatus Omnitrophota bacterium]